MSWQCPICETVNQDVTPVCTVCDNLAPVIQSYLSIESIQLLSEYNAKLDLVHSLEVSGEYDSMFKTALEAISLYKENGLAVDKAKQALVHLNEAKLKDILKNLLNASIEKKNYTYAYSILKIAESLSIDDSDFSSIKGEVRSQISKKNEIDKLLESSYKSIIELDIPSALQIIEEAIKKFPTSKLLQYRRDEIKNLATALNKLKTPGDSVRKHPSIPKKFDKVDTIDTISDSNPSSSSNSKRKFPKIKRK